MKKPSFTLQQFNKPLLLLVVIDFFIIAATSMSQPFWPLIIKTHLRPGQISNLHLWSTLIYATPLIATLFFSPIWGRLADRFGYKKMVLRAAIGLCITQALIGFAPSLTLIVVCRIAQGIFCGFIASVQALATNLTTENRQQLTIANLQSATALGTLIGPMLAGLILHQSNYHWLFALSATLCGLSTLCIILFIPEPSNKTRSKKQLAISQALNEGSTKFFTLIFLAQVARFMLLPLFALYVIHNLSGNQIEVGLLYAISGSTLFIFSPLIARLQGQTASTKNNTWRLICLAFFSCSLLQLVLALSHSIYLSLVVRALWGVALAALLPLLFSLLIKNNHPDCKGKVLGLGNSASKFGNLVGIASGAYCASTIGISNTILLSGGIYLLAFSVALATQIKVAPFIVRDSK